MTINKVCPRYLNLWIFYISYFLDPETQKGIALHELTHFLYFEKWKEVFKNYDENEYEKPYIVWELSEIFAEPIDKDKVLQKLVPNTAKAYEKYYSLKARRDESVMQHFRFYTKITKTILESCSRKHIRK
ncbi:MAG: hypothetical protein ACP5RP_02425 [Candidatus Micrarchaeia archaeon]